MLISPEDHYISQLETQCKYVRWNRLDPDNKQFWGDWLALRQLRTILNDLKPDVVFTFTIKPNIFTGLSLKHLNTKFVPTVTGLGSSFTEKSRLSWIHKWLYKRALSSANEVFFHNSSDHELFKDLGLIDKQASRVIPGSGMNASKVDFKPNPRGKEFVFLFASRILEEKGILEFLEAAENVKCQMDRVKFEVVGAISKRTRKSTRDILSKAAKNNIVTYHGGVDDALPVMEKCDCIVLPSYREGLSRTLLETMAMGRPIIASDVPGCSELVTENGLLTPPKNSAELSKAMITMTLKNHEELYQMASVGRQIVIKKYSVDKVVNFYLSLIQDESPEPYLLQVADPIKG